MTHTNAVTSKNHRHTRRCPSDCPVHDRHPRPTTARDWIADQPGAWVMALFPALAGLIVGAAQSGSMLWTALWLLVCWTLCYCFEFSVARWLKSRGGRRYLPPTIGYGAVLALIGVPFVVLHPDILIWAPIYVVLAGIEFAAAWLRRERSLWGNAAAVIAASLMATIAYGYAGYRPMTSLEDYCAYYDCIVGERMVDLIGPAWPSETGLWLAAIFAVIEFGSVLFVKTMIRERGDRRYMAASWMWHAALLVWWVMWRPMDGWGWMTVVAVVLLLRAVALPVVARRRHVKPMVTGAVEAVANIVALIFVILAWI